MKKYVISLVMLSLVLLISACDSEPKLAKVNDKTITAGEFQSYLQFKRLPAQDKAKRAALLDQYLEREALADEISESKVLDKNLVAAELNEFRKEMLISRYFQKFLQDKVSDQAVQNYYNTHAKDYEVRKAHVAHILLRVNRGMGEAERKAKLTTAQDAYSKIKSGKKFEDIAKQYSEDAISGKKGGDLGWLKEGAIDPRFSKKVFSMSAGDVSEPFETAFGFHIVKLLEGPMVVKRPFEAVKGDISYQLRNQAKDAELKRLTSKVTIKRYE